MWKKLKRGYREFKGDEPGERFVNAHERWREHSKGSVATVLIVVVAIVLIVGGLLLGLVPGVPGVVLAFLGFALIATRFHRMALWLDWTEMKTRRIWKRCRQAMS